MGLMGLQRKPTRRSRRPRRAVALALAVAACGAAAAGGLSGCGGEAEGSPPPVIGEAGITPGRFSHPRGIDIARDGTIAVADKTGRIQLLRADGEPIHHWFLPKIDNGTPTGIIFDETRWGDPTLIVADTHNSRIFRYALDGELLQTIEGHGEGDPATMIFPTDVAVDDEGNIYATEYGGRDRVIKFDREGRFVMDWGTTGEGPGQLSRAMALAWSAPDRILVADSINHRFQLFTTEGELLEVWGDVGTGAGEFKYPYDFAIHQNGLIYVIEYGNNRLQVIGPAGEPIARLGGPGREPGDFHTPWGIAIGPRGRIVVADTGNHRLQVFDPSDITAQSGAVR